MTKQDCSAVQLCLLLSVLFVAYYQFPEVGALGREKTMWQRFFGNCPGHTDIVHTRFVDVKIVPVERGKTFISTTAEVTKPIKEITRIMVKVNRCASCADQGNCKTFYNFVFKNICALMKQKNQLWSAVVNKVEPPEYRRFLFRPGIVSVSNTTIDPDVFANLIPGLEGYYWIIEATGYQKNTPLGCIYDGGEVTTIRA